MNPKKLFDYLDGKLPAREREEIEMQIAGDPRLQRELAIARKLHEAMPGSQEVIGSADESAEPQRGAILGRRLAVAFAVLVFVNVAIGLWFIFQQEKKSVDTTRREAGMRQQVEQSLEKTAASALPTPSIEADEIKIIAPVSQEEAVTAKVIASAVKAGGAGAKALADENGIVVLVDIPKNREAEFRRELVVLGAPEPAPTDNSAKSAAPNERKFLQVRIAQAAVGKKP